MALFEYDENKSVTNHSKHGISLNMARRLWDDPNLIIGPAASVLEERWAAVGRLEEKHWLVIFTYRNDFIRLITCRRARQEEILVYEQSK